MATTKKASETGWFYHAPAKVTNREPVIPPPPSQIPGLSNLPDEAPEENRNKMWIKDTDSPYIKLAKQGGRPDLLRYMSPKPPSEKPKGYPRCDWYYHDDILADEEPKQPAEDHVFMLPDYMVHQEWPAQKQQEQTEAVERQANPAPFAYDQKSAFSRESINPTDKTVKLPEIKPAGYGVRNEKYQNKAIKHTPITRREPIIPQAELDSGKIKYNMMPKEQSDNVVMGKLLAHGYMEDWEVQRQEWTNKQKKVQQKFDAQNRMHAEKNQTEYQEKMATSPIRNMPPAGVTTKREALGFKKVPARTVSHRSQNHGSNPILPDYDPVEPRAGRRPQPVM